jgi:hypothetical protein
MLFEISRPLAHVYGCTTMFIAHPGKDLERGLSGSYRQHGNADFILRTVRLRDGSFRLMKDKDRAGALQRPLFNYTGAYPEVQQTSSGTWRTGAIIGSMQLAAQPDDRHRSDKKPVVDDEDIERVLAEIKSGGPWRLDRRSKTELWIGVPIIKVLGDDFDITKLIGAWLRSGVLKKRSRQDENYEWRDYIEAGDLDCGKIPQSKKRSRSSKDYGK